MPWRVPFFNSSFGFLTDGEVGSIGERSMASLPAAFVLFDRNTVLLSQRLNLVNELPSTIAMLHRQMLGRFRPDVNIVHSGGYLGGSGAECSAKPLHQEKPG